MLQQLARWSTPSKSADGSVRFPLRDCNTFVPAVVKLPVVRAFKASPGEAALLGTPALLSAAAFAASDRLRSVPLMTSTASLDRSNIVHCVALLLSGAVCRPLDAAGADRELGSFRGTVVEGSFGVSVLVSNATVELEQVSTVRHCLIASYGFEGDGFGGIVFCVCRLCAGKRSGGKTSFCDE
jgi:hypothetical protein